MSPTVTDSCTRSGFRRTADTSAGVLLLAAAFVGWLKLLKDRRWPLYGALPVVPFGIVLLQSYGGEVAIRCFLYASPVLALLPITNRGLNTSLERTPLQLLAVYDRVVAQVDKTEIANWGQPSLLGIPAPEEHEAPCFISGQALAECTRDSGAMYVINSTQDRKYREYRESVPQETFDDAIGVLTAENGFEVAYDNDGVTVLQKRDTRPLDMEGSR